MTQELKMKTGYAFYLGDGEEPDCDEPPQELACKDDLKGSVFVKLVEIDDAECAVFKNDGGHFWAQTKEFCQR